MEDTQKKAVSLHFAGDGKRKVQVGYVVEAPIWKTSYRLVLDAENKGGKVDVDALVVKTLTVDQGPKMRRFMPRAMGRAFRIEKKSSHVYVELGTVGR